MIHLMWRLTHDKRQTAIKPDCGPHTEEMLIDGDFVRGRDCREDPMTWWSSR